MWKGCEKWLIDIMIKSMINKLNSWPTIWLVCPPPGILLPSEPATSFLQFPRYRSQKYRQPYPIGKAEGRRQYTISNACYETCEPTLLDSVSLSLRVRMECMYKFGPMQRYGKAGVFFEWNDWDLKGIL